MQHDNHTNNRTVDPPRIAVIGPGALGSLFATRLARAGLSTLLLDYRQERARMLNTRGIKLIEATGETTVHLPVSADPRTLATIDAAIVLVKAYRTEDIAALLAEYLPPTAPVLTLQNGLGNLETLQYHLGQERVFGGTTAQGALLETAGVVRDTGGGPTMLGRLDGKADARQDDLCQWLLQAGFAAAITTDLPSALWNKVILNAAINPLGALTRLRNGQLAAQDESLQLMTAAAREAAAVARAHGVHITEEDWRARLLTICQATAQNINSMLADVLQHRHTEVNAINGAIVQIAEQHHLQTPVNRTLWYLIKTLEHGYLGNTGIA